LGANFRLTGFQAALLLAQLARLPERLETRAASAKYLTGQLAQLDIVTPLYVDEGVTGHSYYLYPMRFNREHFPDPTKKEVRPRARGRGRPGGGGLSESSVCPARLCAL
jgi:dTDP-4-amino-4,6-dideoxygalactose transaminase